MIPYRFYLNFIESFGLVEITEPIGFDKLTFISEQDKKRYGRDSYRLNENASLEFVKGVYGTTNNNQALPNGTIINHLSQGLELLLEERKNKGFEANVEFIIDLDNVRFVTGLLDFATAETDGFSFFKCSVIQQGDKQKIKRNQDINTNVFSSEDLDGNEISPVITENILLKAKPITQRSEWHRTNEFTYFRNFLSGGGGAVYYNDPMPILKSDINDTLSFLPVYSLNQNNTGNCAYVDAENDLKDVIINVSLKGVFKKDFGDFNIGSNIRFFYRVITDVDDPINSTIDFSSFWSVSVVRITNSDPYIDIDLSRTKTTNLPSGSRLIMYFEQNTSFLGGGRTSFKITDFNINISATATAIDTVVKGVRYIDVIKHNIKSLNGYDVYAPKYDVGGEYYNQFLITGNLIKQRDDVPFNVDFKDLMNNLQELNADYQILKDKIYIDHKSGFYPHKEIAAFTTTPDETLALTFNDRYTINEFNYEYEDYEKDKDEENTTDAIHTSSQWLLSNDKVENKKDIKISHVRDAFKINAIKNLSSKTTTATEDDTKICAIDVVNLAPNQRGELSASIKHNITEDGRVQLLKDADLPSWAVLGFDVGADFTIENTNNAGDYIVFEIQDTIITLTPTGFTPTYADETFTIVSYPYTNVLLTNRTNEGLESYSNLLNAENYANLKYSIKRNIDAWKPYLATASLNPDGTFKNTEFISNGLATTKFEDEAFSYTENADIANVDLGTPLLTPNIYKTRLIVSLEQALALIDALDTINEDGTLAGFLRISENNKRVIKVYVQSLEYTPKTGTIEITGEERYESDVMVITIRNGQLTINEVGYAAESLSTPFYEHNGDYFKIYDNENRLVINPTHFSKIEVNGFTFDNSSDLLQYFIDYSI